MHTKTVSIDRTQSTTYNYTYLVIVCFDSPDMSLQWAGILVALQAIKSGALVASIWIYKFE